MVDPDILLEQDRISVVGGNGPEETDGKRGACVVSRQIDAIGPTETHKQPENIQLTGDDDVRLRAQ